ncbi:MAG: HipA domain-containing protein, partial [Gammaproteobacteria bacterium]|nr:HipA domain-containing protein [Gammaproteobacteria bacterium]
MNNRVVRLQVMLGNEAAKVGELVFEKEGERQFSMFRYAPLWLERKDAFAIAPAMPLLDAPFFSAGVQDNAALALPDAIADASPDSWGRALVNATMARRADEIDYLIRTNDLTRTGALRFQDENGVFLSTVNPRVPRLVELSELQQLAHTWETNSSMDKAFLDELQGYVGSLGGARPKSGMDDNGTLSIIKFTSTRDRVPVERAEAATLKLAGLVGINAAASRLELGNTDYPVAVIARFDRRGRARIPYISARTFMGRDAPEPVYYTDIVDMMVAHCEEPKEQMHELYRRILFYILVSNNDDHLQNHGFLYAGNNRWQLSPAFDINPQPLRHRSLKTGISELSGNEASIEAALEAAPYFDLAQDAAVKMLSNMTDVIAGRWRGLFKDAGMTDRDINHYSPAFDHVEMQTARQITGTSAKLF